MSRRHVTVLPSPRPRIVAVGTANPPDHYPQEMIADLLGVPDGVGRRFFRTSGIERRYLYLQPTEDDVLPVEDEGQLLARHRRGSLELGRQAIASCLESADVSASDVDFLCCVSSTGLMMPGLTAMYIRHLGFRTDCQRIDIVGMGCNAALNGLNATASWAAANPGRIALLVCCEINSAVYVNDDRIVTSLVNSLFGDGCGAWLLRTDADAAAGPEVLGWSSHIVPDAWRAIWYQWSSVHNKFELYLDRLIPDVLGEHSPTPISALLEEFHLCRRDVAHWLVHAGGKKVICAVAQANGLPLEHMAPATNVLRDAGNLGSATIIFSYDSLLRHNSIAPGDYGVMVTMGPGATIESALIQW